MLARENMRSVYSEEHQQEQVKLVEDMKVQVEIFMNSIDFEKIYDDAESGLGFRSEMMVNRVGKNATMANEVIHRIVEMLKPQTAGFASSAATKKMLRNASNNPTAFEESFSKLAELYGLADASTMRTFEELLLDRMGRLNFVEANVLYGAALSYEVANRDPRSIDKIIQNTCGAIDDLIVGLDVNNSDSIRHIAEIAGELEYVSAYLSGLKSAA